MMDFSAADRMQSICCFGTCSDIQNACFIACIICLISIASFVAKAYDILSKQ